MKPRLILLIAMTLGFLASRGEETQRDTVSVHFRQSKSRLDTAYMHNGAILDSARNLIDRQTRHGSDLRLADISVTGAASPEGSVSINERLSRRRADRIYDYFSAIYELPDSMTDYRFIGRDWEGLRRMVEDDNAVPYRRDVLRLLDEIVSSKEKSPEKESDGYLQKMKNLHAGVPYAYMYRHLFPVLRKSQIILTFDRIRITPVEPMSAPGLPVTDAIELVEIPICVEGIPAAMPGIQKKPFYMDLKTNMLFDALAVPNIGAEFYLGKNFSIVGNWMYGWWDKDRLHKYWRIYGGDLGLRWWFGKKAHEKPLTGHHVGVYGGVVTYDFEFGGRGWMGGLPGRDLWARCNQYMGVEYGYSLPVTRRLNIDFTLGLGYLGGKYIEYEPKGRWYVWEATKYRHWYGPTKLEISLVWLLGRGNVNMKKGGAR